ncbi:hypothetical protein K438DRAFT_2030390 [Mycena galopus ATCC 62051]|nr:hypothetical protein K438DRAFT_2030390 [Mycena galopus ATCC 62051]
MDPPTGNNEDDNEVSVYNDGRGLKFTVEFTGLFPAGKKKRKNGRRPVIKKSIYIHEDSELSTLLGGAVRALGRDQGDDSLSYSWSPRTGVYSSGSIDIPNMTYTIPKTQFKDMSLTCESEYKDLLTEVMKKTAPDAVKITMSELQPGEEDDETSSEEEQRPKKKKGKSADPSPEELEQTEFIIKLQARWKCNDRTCKRFLCYPDKTTAKHVHLTHFHLQTWAAAAQAKHINDDGSAVDVETPPEGKLYEFQETENEEDEQLLRTRATQKTAAKDSNITINLTLPEPARPLQPLPQQTVPGAPIPRRIPPQLTLEIFCERFHLSDSVHAKLRNFDVTGPHTLRHLKNDHLHEAGLNHAEVNTHLAGESEEKKG